MLGDRSQVLADLNRSIELDPKNPQAYFFRGGIFYSNQNASQALADFDRAILLDPKYTQVHLFRALRLQSRGDAPGALAAYTKIIALDRLIGLEPTEPDR
ncbi:MULTISPECIES: tetratricopeptide repeat protein [unclassified Chamaesiphon]|uniref:tetratricopeptide repeat protein n=1 Tax=unclassified Chamaesiphon TaxID=2620921 RepID=UPI0037BEAB60